MVGNLSRFTGNLTKHMKSKAHMKKCLELGVSVTMDETEIQEQGKALTCTKLYGTCLNHSRMNPTESRCVCALKWMTSNKNPRRRWWPRPSTSSQTRRTLTAWMKMLTKSTKTTTRMRNMKVTPRQSCVQGAPVLSRVELLLCRSQPPPLSTAVPSPLCPTLKSATSPPAGGWARTNDLSSPQTSERSPWMKTLLLCCPQSRPASCLTHILLACSLLVGSHPSGSPRPHVCVIRPRGENSPREVDLLLDGTRPR